MKIRTVKRMGLAAGFTLVEVSISLLVLAVGMVSILAIFPVGLKWAGESRNNATLPHAVATVAATVNNYTSSPYLRLQNDGDSYPFDASGYYMIVERLDKTSDTYTTIIHCYGSKSDRDAVPPKNQIGEFRFKHYKNPDVTY